MCPYYAYFLLIREVKDPFDILALSFLGIPGDPDPVGELIIRLHEHKGQQERAHREEDGGTVLPHKIDPGGDKGGQPGEKVREKFDASVDLLVNLRDRKHHLIVVFGIVIIDKIHP